jgi:transposase
MDKKVSFAWFKEDTMARTQKNEKHVVHLSPEEKSAVRRLTARGKSSARKIKRAAILLMADGGQTDEAIKTALQTSLSTINRTRKRYVEAGLESALTEQPRPGRPVAFEGKVEAQMIAIACSKAPDGRKHWTMQLIADRLVALKTVESISDESVRLRLKKVKSSLGNISSGVCPK